MALMLLIISCVQTNNLLQLTFRFEFNNNYILLCYEYISTTNEKQVLANTKVQASTETLFF